MQYTDNEAALIGGLISNYFFQPSVDAKLRESYRRVLRHLHENTLSASDLSRIQNALTFLSPLCRDNAQPGFSTDCAALAGGISFISVLFLSRRRP